LPAEVLTVLSAAALRGRFANAEERLQTDYGAFRVIYTGTEVQLSQFAPCALPTTTAGTPTATPDPSVSESPNALTPTPSPTATTVGGSGCIGDCNGDTLWPSTS
jgi:hypothetical protein